jgi:hypothetical protein
MDISTGKVYESRHAVFLEDGTAFNLRNEQLPLTTYQNEIQSFDEFMDVLEAKADRQSPSSPIIQTSNQFQIFALDENISEDEEAIVDTISNGEEAETIQNGEIADRIPTYDNHESTISYGDIDERIPTGDNQEEDIPPVEVREYVLQDTSTPGVYIDSSNGRVELEPITNNPNRASLRHVP